jgi:hypothetical protein
MHKVKHSISHKAAPRNRHHVVSSNAHAKGNLKITVAKKGGMKKKGHSRKTMLT